MSTVRSDHIQFWQDFSEKTIQKKIPFKVDFELTYGCNLSCCHCYVAADSGKNEMTLREIYSILDQLASENCFYINFTGGEIFTRPDIFDILDYAKKKGFCITLLTNATLITPKAADRLKEIGIHSAEITLYGITEKIHENITGTAGSFRRCLDGIDMLRERKIQVCLKTVVMNMNADEVIGIRAFAEERNLHFQYSWHLHARNDGNCEPLRYRLSPERVMELSLYSAESGENALKTLEKLNEKSYQAVKYRVAAGSEVEATEDPEILAEFLDWGRCLSIGIQSQNVFKHIYEAYVEAGKKRNEHITRKIDDSLKSEEICILFMREGHQVQFPRDIEIFYVAPPALDPTDERYPGNERILGYNPMVFKYMELS